MNISVWKWCDKWLRGRAQASSLSICPFLFVSVWQFLHLSSNSNQVISQSNLAGRVETVVWQQVLFLHLNWADSRYMEAIIQTKLVILWRTPALKVVFLLSFCYCYSLKCVIQPIREFEGRWLDHVHDRIVRQSWCHTGHASEKANPACSSLSKSSTDLCLCLHFLWKT